MSMDQFFYTHPVFRYEDFTSWKAQQGKIQRSSVNTALRYYIKKGRIKLIRRKLYASVPPNQSSDKLIVDPYLIAGKVTEDAILGYHTVLELMGAAYSTFNQFTYLTHQKSKSFEFQGQLFRPVSPPTALQKKRTILESVETVNRQGLALRVTNAARTFVDTLDRIELCGGWEEVYRSIAKLVVLDVDEVVSYSLMLENACLNAKVGYCLSQRQNIFATDQQKLAPLLRAKPKTPQYASKRTSKESFQLVKQWNILLPVSVINQSWEEPYVDI